MPNQKLDFLIIAPTPFYAHRGCHMRIRGEAEALKRKGRSLVILTYPQGENVEGLDIVRSPVQFGNYGKGVSATWKNIPAGLVLFWFVLREVVYRHPKVIYGHLFEGAAIGIVVKYLAIFLSLFSYFPILVLDAQDSLSDKMVSYGMYKQKSWLFTIFRLIEKNILLFPNYIFTSSLQGGEALKKIYPHINPITVPDGISIFHDEFSLEYVNNFKKNDGKQKALSIISSSFLASQYALIKEWIKNQNPIVVYGGSYSSGKGFPDFVKNILPELLKNKGTCFLFGGGKVSEVESLQKLIEKNPERVVCLTDLNLKNLLHFYLIGDIAVDCKPPRTTESSGKILNYMAAGLPVVCYNQANNQYFLNDGGRYASNDAEFKEEVNELCAYPKLCVKMGKHNLERAWTKLNWDNSAEIILKTIYK